MSMSDNKDGRRVTTGVAAAAFAAAAALGGASGIVTQVPNVSSLGLAEFKSLGDNVLGNTLTRLSEDPGTESAAAFQN